MNINKKTFSDMVKKMKGGSNIEVSDLQMIISKYNVDPDKWHQKGHKDEVLEMYQMQINAYIYHHDLPYDMVTYVEMGNIDAFYYMNREHPDLLELILKKWLHWNSLM